jgi:hypothetical protein
MYLQDPIVANTAQAFREDLDLDRAGASLHRGGSHIHCIYVFSGDMATLNVLSMIALPDSDVGSDALHAEGEVWRDQMNVLAQQRSIPTLERLVKAEKRDDVDDQLALHVNERGGYQIVGYRDESVQHTYQVDVNKHVTNGRLERTSVHDAPYSVQTLYDALRASLP